MLQKPLSAWGELQSQKGRLWRNSQTHRKITQKRYDISYKHNTWRCSASKAEILHGDVPESTFWSSLFWWNLLMILSFLLPVTGCHGKLLVYSLKVSGILVITGRSVTQIKGVIFHCNTAQIQDKLGPTERSSQNGSLNHNTILHLDLFCRRQGKWCEIPYVQDIVVIYQDSSIYQRIRECPKRRELQTWPWYCEWYIPEWSVSPRKGPTIRPSCFIIPKL